MGELPGKVVALDHADDENARLREENAGSSFRSRPSNFSCHAKSADAATTQTGARLSQETGSRIGRTIASFDYRIPDQLPPSQLYALGVSYFKAGENEKAAAILSTLATFDGRRGLQGRPRSFDDRRGLVSRRQPRTSPSSSSMKF